MSEYRQTAALVLALRDLYSSALYRVGKELLKMHLRGGYCSVVRLRLAGDPEKTGPRGPTRPE